MRFGRSLSAVALLWAVGLVAGQDAPAPDDGATVAATQTTSVTGTAPDLEGRWLVLPAVGVAGGAQRLVPSVWEFTRKDGALELNERLVVFPAAQAAAIEKANEELGGAWTPTPEDLAAINAEWDTLTPEPRGVSSMKHEVMARDGYDDDLHQDALTKDALWVVRQGYGFAPGGSRPISQANLIAPLKYEAGVYSGNYLAVTIAAAPFPITIKFDGTVRLFPLQRAPLAPPSVWKRLGDLFTGCNRT